MFEVKARGVETKESSTETDEGSSSKQCSSVSLGSGSGSGSGSLYLYDSQDWVVSPVVSPDEPGSTISPMLAEETFRYMTYLAAEPSCSRPGAHSLSKVLSGDRVEQMTKTYNDMDVVTHLLAERDRDLELAARIGQSLLHRNHVLQERNESVEEQLSQALDQVHQLQHELCKKDALLRMVASASEESDTESGCSTPSKPRPPQPPGAAALLALSQLDSLQGKLAELEEENVTLRSEARLLKRETVSYEEKEQRLVSDCVKELRESNTQMVSLTDELSQTNEELRRHQEEIAQLLSQIVQLQHRVKELALEKEELRIHLQASKNAQRQLTAELDELADRNAECVGMLQESQEEIRELRSKTTPPTGLRRHLPYGLLPMDSLAAEIEGTMRKELSVEEEMTFQDQRVSQKRVFQTVRSVNEAAERAATPPIPGSARCSSLVMTAQPFRSGQSQDGNREEARLGRPGAPGGNDLVAALHRLSLRRQNFLCERQFFQAERDRKLGPAAAAAAADGEGSGWSSPTGSAFSSFSSLSEFSGCFKTFLPEKLQIVKPMEGSLTLHHWQQLAKPHLATILDPHPGVVTKGFRPLPQDAVYRLTDLEEDEEDERRGRRGGRRGGGEEEEEEGGGITFQVQCSSTPEEKRERKRPPSADSAPAVLPSPPVTTSDLGATFAPVDVIGTSAAALSSAQTAPVMTFGSVQSQSHISTTTITTTTTTTTSSSSSSSTAPNPGKCQSSTFSTYTFTTCRILHPSDLTHVTPSCQSSVSVHTPSSLRSGPSTPVTPCRLSLGDSSSFSPLPLRPAPPPPGGLAKLLLEKGISAQTPPKPRPPLLLPRLLPGTPPNSPSNTPPPSPAPSQPRPSVVVAPDNFLASRPAELFLQDVYGLNLGRAPRTDLPSPSPSPSSDSAPSPGHAPKPDPVNLDLLGRLRRLGLAGALRGRRDLSLEGGAGASTKPRPPPDSATFVAAGGGSLLDGLRRNQSLPVMIGARGGGGPVYSSSQPTPPPAPPTSLALAPPPWGDLKEPPRRRPASLSQATPTALPKR